MFEGFRRGRMQLADVTINYLLGGSGPPVLLLHGYPQNLSMWARVAPILAQRFTVVCADLRGYGDSSKPAALPDSSNYSFRAMADDQVALMKSLGHERFHAVGHDRGGRAAHRMALDHPEAVASLAVLDIVPTHAMYMETDRHRSQAYWHWYFLAQPAPFPERLIGADPDFFFETCLVGWGKTRLEDFDQEMLADYRRCWRPGDDLGELLGLSRRRHRRSGTRRRGHREKGDLSHSRVLGIEGPDAQALGHRNELARAMQRCPRSVAARRTFFHRAVFAGDR